MLINVSACLVAVTTTSRRTAVILAGTAGLILRESRCAAETNECCGQHPRRPADASPRTYEFNMSTPSDRQPANRVKAILAGPTIGMISFILRQGKMI